jgi:hypothetical protein
MLRISLFKVGLVAMLFFVFASNVLNYVSIASRRWASDASTGLWISCTYPGTAARDKCLKINPAALIATGTALNILSFLLIIVAQVAICVARFRDSIALYFVIGSFLTTLLSIVFNSVGWFYVFVPSYQNMVGQSNGANAYFSFDYGWGFWMMTGVLASSIIAALIGAAILGCTCITNKEEHKRRQEQAIAMRSASYVNNGIENPGYPSSNQYYASDDPQVLRL